LAIVDDVNQALVDFIDCVLYPNGDNMPSLLAAQGLAGKINIFPGWPNIEDVDNPALRPYAQGGSRLADISVVDFGTPRSTTRYALRENVVVIPAATLTWSISGDTATLGGNATVPQNLCISAGGVDYLTAVQPSDTLATITARLAALIPGATSNGPSLTATFLDAARVGVLAQTATEVARQISNIRIGIYCGEKVVSMAIIRAIKPAIDRASRLILPDSSVIHVLQGTEASVWPSEKTGIRTKTLIYPVEYPSLLLGTAAQAIAWTVNVTADTGPTVVVQG